MRILVAGSGGVGGLLAGTLARIHEDTFLYARGDSLQAIRERGLVIRSKAWGDFTSRPHVSDKPEALGKADILFIAVKGNHLTGCLEEIAPALSPQSIIIPLLNGIDAAKRVKEILPAASVAEGVIYVFSHRTAPGEITQTAGSLRIVFGMNGKENPPMLQEMAALLRNAGFDASLSSDMRREIWKKFAVMGGNSAALFALGGPAGHVRTVPGYRMALQEIAKEVMAAAATEGIALDPVFPKTYEEGFASLPDGDMTSLYRDIVSGKDPADTEAESVLGTMVRIGIQKNIPMYWFSIAYGRALQGTGSGKKMLVSACLLGRCCKYSGGHNYSSKVAAFLKGQDILPVCPEVLSELSVPRPPVEIRGGRVVNQEGKDLTSVYETGVRRVMKMIDETPVSMAVLKARSPTCGVKEIYDGSFSGRRVPGKGLLARALAKRGIPMKDDDDFQ